MRARSEETRERILAAAEECFTRYGYDATGVAEICKRAEVSKGTFFHYFPTKQALLLELIERWLTNLESQLKGLRPGTSTVPEAFLQVNYRRLKPTASCRHDWAFTQPLRARSRPSLSINKAEFVSR